MQQQRPSSARRKAPIRAPDHAEDERTTAPSARERAARSTSTRDVPMDIHELHSSLGGRSTSSFHAADHLPAASADSGLPSDDPCTCSEFRSLRCNDKLYSMLHNQIELDAGMMRRQAAAAAAAAAERAHLKALFGGDLPPDPADSSEERTLREATMRYHASDFHLGNLKNQTTRVVLPPTIVYSNVRPTEAYFSSVQTGGLMRKTKAKVTSALIMEDILSFGRRNMSEALANLGKRNKQDERAWAMEEEKYTHQLQFGSADGKRPKTAAAAESSQRSNLPHYMQAIRKPSSKSVLAPKHVVVSSSTRATMERVAQHPLTSSPGTQPQQHCDIIAQFTFASDSPRYNNPALPYTCVAPGSALETSPHAFPDILYLSVRSLHHFLHVVNVDPQRPRATGVLQPFVRSKEERNTVYRVSFTALDATEFAMRTASANGGTSTGTSQSSLPASFHVSIEGRQNVLKLVDHSGTGPRTADGQEFTLAERAATFDAAHLSMQVEGGAARRRGDESAPASTGTTAAPKAHVLYPRLPSALAAQLGPVPSAPVLTSRGRTVGPSNTAATTLIVPSSYPWSPSASTAAQRLSVPPTLQARLQAAMLRMVSHVNELYRVSERRAKDQRDQQVALQRELYASRSLASAPPLLPMSPNISVGYLEASFKVDAANNLFLLTARSLKHLVREPPVATTHESVAPPAYVRCAQCYRLCDRPADVLAVQSSKLVRPTSAMFDPPPESSEQGDDSYATPFYARRGGDDDDDDERRRHRRSSAPVHGRGSSAMVFGVGRKPRDAEPPRGRGDEYDRSLWPESHFHPPEAPEHRFQTKSDRVQSNPLFDHPNVHIRDEDDEGADEEDDEARAEEAAVQRAIHQLQPEPMPPTEDKPRSKPTAARPESAKPPPPKLKASASASTSSVARKARPSSAAPSSSVRRPQSALAASIADLTLRAAAVPRRQASAAVLPKAQRSHSPPSSQPPPPATDYRMYNVHFDSDPARAAQTARELAKMASLYPGMSTTLLQQAPSRVVEQRSTRAPFSHHAAFGDQDADLSIEIEENQ